MQNMFVDLQLKSDYGNAHVRAIEKYHRQKIGCIQCRLDTRKFRLDKLMNDTIYGSVTEFHCQWSWP
jgi:hypothetical protein